MSDTQPQVLLLSGRFQVRGSCTYTLRLAEGLPRFGVTPRIVCPDASLVPPVQRTSLPLREYPQLDWPFYNQIVLRQIKRDLLADPPDLIHLQSRRVLKAGRWLARQLNRPFILSVHDYLAPHEYVELHRPLCARVITVSESVKRDFITKTRFPGEQVSVIPTGVDAETPRRDRAILAPDHTPVVGTAGPLEAVKGLPFFLGAAARILATGREVEFLIAGAGPEEGNLRRLARELGIANKVTFVPYLVNFEKSLAAMDVFCLPSLQQGLGTIMLEAMALGLPVIASRVGGVYSVLHDQENGLLVPPSDSRALADRIQELLGDPLRARQIGESGRQLVQREYGLDRMLQDTAELYRMTLRQHAARSAPAPQLAVTASTPGN